MRRQILYITIASSTCLQPLSGEQKPVVILSPELQFQAPPVPDEKNGIMVLESRLADQDIETDVASHKGLEKLRSGKAVEDVALIEQLKRRHKIARQTLKAPVQCRKEANRIGSLLAGLFSGAELLSRQCSREGDYEAAMSYLKDMLEWSGLIRNANPNSALTTLARSGWENAFNCAFQEWESHPDQEAGLRAIEKLFHQYRMPQAEYAQVIRREAQLWAERGGPRGFLHGLPLHDPTIMLLQRPLNNLTPAKILELRYDHETEVLRYETEALQIVDILRSGGPLNSWPGFNYQPVGKTFQDYKDRPNGLGDLFYDYGTSLSRAGMFLTFSKDPAVETCIAWLKTEGTWKKFVPGGPETKLDPMDGKQLRIDLEKRWILSLAPDQKLDHGEKYPQGTGFGQVGTDPCLQVPKWRGRH